MGNKLSTLKTNVTGLVSKTNFSIGYVDKSDGINKLLSWTLIVVLLFTIFILYNIITRSTANFKKNNNLNFNYAINPVDSQDELLINYHILGSYHSACSDEITDDVVSIESVKNVIKTGVRLLHFQLFYVKGNPVVSVSTDGNIFRTNTYNTLPLKDVCRAIYEYSFSSGYVNNYNDPMMVYFEIMSVRKNMYNDIAEILKTELKERLLPAKYGAAGQFLSSEQNIQTIEHTPLKEYANGKITIIVSEFDKRKNSIICATNLYSLVNILVHSTCDNRIHNDSDYIQTHSEIKDSSSTNKEANADRNKNQFSIAIPDKHKAKNYDTISSHDSGFNAIFFYLQKNNVSKIMEKFKNKEDGTTYHAFTLKQEDLRSYKIGTKPDASGHETGTLVTSHPKGSVGGEEMSFGE